MFQFWRHRSLTNGEDVRRQRAQRLSLVLFDGVGRVQLPHVLVRVDRQQDVGHVRLPESRVAIVRTLDLLRWRVMRVNYDDDESLTGSLDCTHHHNMYANHSFCLGI